MSAPIINALPLPPSPQLAGEAAKAAYAFRSGDGGSAEPSHSIFPIVRYDAQNQMHLLGTGFFISTNGLFVTARHVLTDPFDSKGEERFPIGIIQFIGGIYIKRPILRCTLHKIADVAVGVAAPMKRTDDGKPLTNPVLTLTTLAPSLGTRVFTYAYPKHTNEIIGAVQRVHLEPTYYDGEIEEYHPAGRDQIIHPEPCYRTSVVLHGGASGGPVFSRSGTVFGVNSSGFDGADISYVSRINEVFGLAVDGVAMSDGALPRSVSLLELARAGRIIVRPPIADGMPGVNSISE